MARKSYGSTTYTTLWIRNGVISCSTDSQPISGSFGTVYRQCDWHHLKIYVAITYNIYNVIECVRGNEEVS